MINNYVSILKNSVYTHFARELFKEHDPRFWPESMKTTYQPITLSGDLHLIVNNINSNNIFYEHQIIEYVHGQ